MTLPSIGENQRKAEAGCGSDLVLSYVLLLPVYEGLD